CCVVFEPRASSPRGEPSGRGRGTAEAARLAQILDALLARDRLLGAFARAGVRPRPLAADRQTEPVADAAVGRDVPQAINVLSDLPAQGPLDRIIAFEQHG